MTYRYFPGAERRYCYHSTADMRCRFGSPSAVGCPPVPDELRTAADELARFGIDLAELLARAHRQTTRIEAPDKLGTCAACGSRLEKIGYRAWVEVPIETVDISSLDSLGRHNLSLKFGQTHVKDEKSVRWFGLKREAIAWAREEAELERSYDDAAAAA